MKLDPSDLLRRSMQARSLDRYGSLRTVCLAGLLFLSFYAVTSFPAFYEQGPTGEQWGMIGAVLLSAILLLQTERSASSRSGKRPHDWNSAGGTLHAFSFRRRCCSVCGARRVLAFQEKGKTLRLLTPGLGVPEGSTLRYYCPYCADTAESHAQDLPFLPARVRGAALSALSQQLRGQRGYRLEQGYRMRFFYVTLVLCCAEISCLYLARRAAVWLILPLVCGYFLYVSFKNMVIAFHTRYYLTADAVIQRIPGGYARFGLEPGSSLVRFSDGDRRSWGLYTATENLLLSPIIDGQEELIRRLRDACRDRGCPVVE